ncbi:MAG: AAA family ATPase [Ideonella sp.]|nr:AAA family ATPase [Ideonella sp.]MCC7455821.1 AAA family ATPase [Nitrospira sp.]
MYAAHFGLKREPFSIAPDPRYLFMSERHREALAHLLYGVRGGGGFVLLTGEIGAGKTTVCRCFLEQVPPRSKVAYIFNPKLTALELLQSVCAEFRIDVHGRGGAAPTLKDHVDALNEHLLRTHAEGENCVLIIDEAQNLSPDVLEQLRLLTNLETNERKLLQIILIGQPELRDMLARPDLEQLAQRVVARYHLDPLSEDETSHYIKHRLSVAGLSGLIPFDREARHRIHELTRGVPRRINLLCDRALLGAYANGRQRVDRATVDQAAIEVFDGRRRNATVQWTRRRAWLTGGAVAAVALGAGGAAAWWLGARHSAAASAAVATAAAASAAVARGAVAPAASAATPAAASGPATAGSSAAGATTAASSGTAPAATTGTAAAAARPAPPRHAASRASR